MRRVFDRWRPQPENADLAAYIVIAVLATGLLIAVVMRTQGSG